MKYLLICFMFVTCANCPEDFYSKVLSDVNSRHSYFISMEIKVDSGQISIVVENGDLFYFLSSENKNLTEEEYISSLKNILLNKEALNLGSVTVGGNLRYYKLNPCSNVEEIAKKGKEGFISYYFKNGVLKTSIQDNELHCVISKLFEWCMLTKIDDESGYLVIEESKE